MKIDFNEKVGARSMTKNSLPTIRGRKFVARSMTKLSSSSFLFFIFFLLLLSLSLHKSMRLVSSKNYLFVRYWIR
jgi:hypothetical protein